MKFNIFTPEHVIQKNNSISLNEKVSVLADCFSLEEGLGYSDAVDAMFSLNYCVYKISRYGRRCFNRKLRLFNK
jgi:hypothetical protein